MTTLQKELSIPSVTPADIYNGPIQVTWTQLVEMRVIHWGIERTHCERFRCALMEPRAADAFEEDNALIRRIDSKTNYALVDQTSFGMIQTQKTMLMEPQTFSGRRTAQDLEGPGRQVMRFHQ
jgi:hypothetical protein